MNVLELQNYLYEKMPQVKSMEVVVENMGPEHLTVSAPLEPNINHRDSVFGGSASSIAILAAWAFLHQKLVAEGISTTLVIQKNTMSYDVPITGKFLATAQLNNEAEWNRFISMLRRRGKSRINISSLLEFAGKEAGKFEGTFVAVGCEAR